MLAIEKKEELFKETLALADQIYEKYNVGGPLYMFFENQNIKNHHIEFCIYEIQKLEVDKELFLQCAYNLLKMNKNQRIKLIQKESQHEYVKLQAKIKAKTLSNMNARLTKCAIIDMVASMRKKLISGDKRDSLILADETIYEYGYRGYAPLFVQELVDHFQESLNE